MARAIGYRSLPRFQARANFVFRGLTLTGKSLLAWIMQQESV
jgi:hypothetical protein